MPPIFNLIGFGFLRGLMLYLLRAWVLDIQFYRRNGWDFSKDSGRFIYPGAGPFNPPNTKPIGNGAKMYFGYPFLIAAFSAGIIIVYIFDVRGK